MSVTLEVSQFEMEELNTLANWNILLILVTFDVSHLEMSGLKVCA